MKTNQDNTKSFEAYKKRLNAISPGLGNETPDYNLRGAYDAKMVPTMSSDGRYHLGSRNPNTGEILKRQGHPTWDLMLEGEKEAGYEVYQEDEKWFSRKKKEEDKEEDNVWKNKEFITDFKRDVHARSTTDVATPEIKNYPYTETDYSKNRRLKRQEYEGRVEVEVNKRLEEIPSVKKEDRNRYDERELPVRDVLNVSEKTPLTDDVKERMYKDDIYKNKLVEDFLSSSAVDDKVYADEVFRDKYGQSIHSFLYENDEEYRERFKEANTDGGTIRYTNTDLRNKEVVPPQAMWMYPHLKGEQQRAMTDFSNQVIEAALPIPGIDKMGKIPAIAEYVKRLGRTMSSGRKGIDLVEYSDDGVNLIDDIVGQKRIRESLESADPSILKKLPASKEEILIETNNLSNKSKKEFIDRLSKKRPDLVENGRIKDVIKNTDDWLGTLDSGMDNKKIEKLALHWISKGNVILPEDGEKILTAMKIAERNKKDPFSFKSPNEIFSSLGEVKTKREKLLNPDDLPTFTNKKKLNNDIVIYDVEDSKEGQEQFRKLIDSHLGEGFDNWCTTFKGRTYNGIPNKKCTEQSWDAWERMYPGPKKAVFKKGKLYRNFTGEQFWDLEDKPHSLIKSHTEKIKGDKLERYRNVGLNTEGEFKKIKGSKNNEIYKEWDDKDNLIKTIE